MGKRQVSRSTVAGACLLASTGGLLHGLCFPPWAVWRLALVAPALVVCAARAGGPGCAAASGWLAGTVAASLAVTPWMMAATLDYFRQGPLGALVFASLVGQVFHALPMVAFALGVWCFAAHARAAVRIVATAGLWILLELLRSRLGTGAPWDLLGHAFFAQPLWIQAADLGGVPLLSGLCVVVAAALAELRRAPRVAMPIGLLTLAAWLGYGAMRLAVERDDSELLRVALVQGAVPNAWRADPARAPDALAAFVSATRETLESRPALVVWPENAVSFLLEPNEVLRAAAAALLQSSGALLLTGGPRFAQDEPGRVAFFNSAFLLDGHGTVRATYDKRRLVPFAEYAPLPRLPALGWRFDAPGDYTAGRHPTVFPDPAPFGVLICFEAIYPDLARDLVRGGAEFLVNISNDAWFGTSAGLEQHFAITVFRAVEFRRALARATNTGVTAVIGPSGRQLAAFPREQRGAWTVAVPRRRDETVYARFGDGPLALLAMSAVVSGLLGAATARRARHRGGRGDA